MDPKQLYLYALGEAAKVATEAGPDQMKLPTPDTEWTVRDLLQHIVYEVAWVADIVAGKTIAEIGTKYDGDLLDNDPVVAWRHYETLTRAAVEGSDVDAVAHLSYTDTTVGEYLLEAGNDVLVHAWDLGQAIGVDVVFDENAAKLLYDKALPRKDEFAGSGLFADPIAVSESASTQTKLLALLGRSERWRK